MPHRCESQAAKQATSVSESCAQSWETPVILGICRMLDWWIECCEMYFWENMRDAPAPRFPNVSLESQLIFWINFTIVKKNQNRGRGQLTYFKQKYNKCWTSPENGHQVLPRIGCFSPSPLNLLLKMTVRPLYVSVIKIAVICHSLGTPDFLT